MPRLTEQEQQEIIRIYKNMCGRFTLDLTTKFSERFKISNRLDGLTARYNIAPSQDVPVIIRNSPNRIVMMRWGLIPLLPGLSMNGTTNWDRLCY
jgi:putative SOS response-associated peptidase YedK